MGVQRTSFDKLQRDRAKKAKQAAKREKRQGKGPDDDGLGDSAALVATLTESDAELSAPELLAMIEAIHQQFEAEEITFEEFEERKAELFARLPID